MSIEPTDGELARQIAAGDARQAEALLVERMSRRVYLYGMRHLRDEVRAQDLAQEVMALVLVRLRQGEVREPDRIGSFVLGTARWMTRDTRRRERRTQDLADRLEREPRPPPEPIRLVDRDRLRACLEALSEHHRTVVALTFAGDRSAAEVAEALGTTPGNVRVVRHRAVAKLRTCMGEA